MLAARLFIVAAVDPLFATCQGSERSRRRGCGGRRGGVCGFAKPDGRRRRKVPAFFPLSPEILSPSQPAIQSSTHSFV
eukprot:scaffold318778_cov23-Prasinocladus_malaysianus.AAC.1